MGSWTAEARRFLEAHRVGHLATSGADGAPHVVPLCYAVDDSALYFVADEKPKRRPAPTRRRRGRRLRRGLAPARLPPDTRPGADPHRRPRACRRATTPARALFAVR